MKKQKVSKHGKDSLLLKLRGTLDQKLDNEEKVPTRFDYVEKRKIDRSTLYSFDRLFQLTEADVANLEFLRKSARTPIYSLLAVDLYSSKVHVYSMRSRKQILQIMKQFYEDMESNSKSKTMRLQVDNEFQQVKIKNLNDKNNVEMFTSS